MTADATFRTATKDDVPAIVALLADDAIGAGREGDVDVYWTAFAAIDADPRNHLIVADIDGEVAGTLQLTFIPGLSRNFYESHGFEATHEGMKLPCKP